MVHRPGDIMYLAGSAYPKGLPCEVLAVDDTGTPIKIKALCDDQQLGRMGFLYEGESLETVLLILPGGSWVALAWEFSMN